ncbi:hypothetical protein ABFA07_000557 [Porites harrisoni]
MCCFRGLISSLRRIKACRRIRSLFQTPKPTGIRCTEDNDKLHEMLRVVEQIKIARTDRIKKILTGCIRLTETANHDGEVEFISLDAQMMPVFPSNTPPVN